MPPSTTVSGSHPVFVDLLSALQPMPPPLTHRTETQPTDRVRSACMAEPPSPRSRCRSRPTSRCFVGAINFLPSFLDGVEQPDSLMGFRAAACCSPQLEGSARAALSADVVARAHVDPRSSPASSARPAAPPTGGLRATLLLDARAVDSGPHYLCACEIVGRALARMHMHVRS